jgi:hypothetical protein
MMQGNLSSQVPAALTQEQVNDHLRHPSISVFVSSKTSPLQRQLVQSSQLVREASMEPYVNQHARDLRKYTDKVRVQMAPYDDQ